ncbi:MAG: hypothetical protein ACKVOW_17245, partial [Chitinophagaceae bacterium]
MKYFIFVAGLIISCFTSGATTYFSQGSVSPNNLSSWNSNRLGGGFAPVSFTAPGDQFVIQNTHVLYTTSIWTIGSASTTLIIESGGILYASFSIFFSGTFQIDNGGIYYHDNASSVSTTAGSSIFGGVESFASSSTVEIRNWINHTTPLPASVNWGNLVINYSNSIGGNWNQQGALSVIQGNLILKRTGTAGQDFRLTLNNSFALTIGGNLEIDQAILFIKEGNLFGTTAIVQVNGDVTINNGILNLGTVDLKPNNEFRFRGNLLVTGNGNITAQSEDPMLVANSNSVQSFYCTSTLNTSFKVAPGAGLKLNSPLTLGSLRALVIAGTFVAGTNPITLNSGILAVSGGLFNSSGKINMKDGQCQVCQGMGNFSGSNGWCSTSGDTGVINFSSDTLLFNRSLASSLKIGSNNSKGKLFLTNQAMVAFTGSLSGPFPNRGSIELTGNGTLSFDENSAAIGDAFYSGNGGWLSTGASPGLLPTAPAGNIQVTGSRNYDAGGINSFEYKSIFPQFTGSGLPSIITGTLKVSNSNPSGLTLSNALSIATGGTLYLENGIVKAINSSFLITMNRNSTLLGGSALSYVDGPLKKIGEQNFTFHIGKSGRYSPLVLNANGGGSATDFYTVEYNPGNPQSVYGNQLFQMIDHISNVEYWLINGTPGPRQMKLKITPYSGVTDLPSLVVSYFDGQGWINLGNGIITGSPTNGSIEVAPVNYGPFTLASTNFLTNPFSASLPIHILSFSARRNGNQGILSWEVSADTDADRFELLSSKDNRLFVPMAAVSAKNGQHSYQYTDNFLQNGTTYYRIKVIEKNGVTGLSKIAAIFFGSKGLELINASPSIVNQHTVISIASS